MNVIIPTEYLTNVRCEKDGFPLDSLVFSPKQETVFQPAKHGNAKGAETLGRSVELMLVLSLSWCFFMSSLPEPDGQGPIVKTQKMGRTSG